MADDQASPRLPTAKELVAGEAKVGISAIKKSSGARRLWKKAYWKVRLGKIFGNLALRKEGGAVHMTDEDRTRELRAAFDAVDVDGGGSIDVEELVRTQLPPSAHQLDIQGILLMHCL